MGGGEKARKGGLAVSGCQLLFRPNPDDLKIMGWGRRGELGHWSTVPFTKHFLFLGPKL